jgi:hypothetical protein
MGHIKDFIVRGDNWAFYHLRAKGIFNKMSDEAYLKMLWRRTFHKKLNLKKPETFNEKLQWLKIHDRRQEYTAMVDKYEAKRYVAERIGEEYIIPTLGVWGSFDEIDFDSLPDQFVLKCTHDSGGLAICRDKNSFDKAGAKAKIERSLKRNYYWTSREWPYKNVKPRIIAEQYMEDGTGAPGLTDYKFFCFGGEPKLLYASQGLENHATASISFFDLDGKRMPFYRSDYRPMEGDLALPKNFAQMREVAAQLAKEVAAPFVRIDLYSIGGKTMFSEITFSPCGGMLPFEPAEWDKTLGDWIQLSK